jgi:hypothetical protein
MLSYFARFLFVVLAGIGILHCVLTIISFQSSGTLFYCFIFSGGLCLICLGITAERATFYQDIRDEEKTEYYININKTAMIFFIVGCLFEIASAVIETVWVNPSVFTYYILVTSSVVILASFLTLISFGIYKLYKYCCHRYRRIPEDRPPPYI